MILNKVLFKKVILNKVATEAALALLHKKSNQHLILVGAFEEKKANEEKILD